MSDDLNEFGGYDGDQQSEQKSKSEGGGLRAKLEEALKRASEAESRLTEVQKQLNSRTAADLFGKFGVPEKVQKFYSGDVTEEAITQWVKENAELFGISLPGAEAAETPEDKARNDQLRATQNASRVGFDGGNISVETALSEANAKLQAGASEADIDAAINQMFGKR